jgi:hypothetical protein
MGFVPIKWPQCEKVSPPSFRNIMALMAQCITKKLIRNKPVRAMINFLPRELVTNWVNHFIM